MKLQFMLMVVFIFYFKLNLKIFLFFLTERIRRIKEKKGSFSIIDQMSFIFMN
jgi:hypothetical protein